MRGKQGSRLKLVGETEAPSRTREIFCDVRHCLGLPAVPQLYQAYAAFPEFLELHWEAFRPAVRSQQFFALAARLAAESYTRSHNYFEIRSLAQREAGTEMPTGLSLSQVLDYYQYLDPLLLLVAATQMQAFEEPIGQSTGSAEMASHARFPVAPCLLPDEQASPRLQRSWQERRRMLELAFISDEHRALAYWPAFYMDHWAVLKELLVSPVYADCQFRLAESALEIAGELPVRVETGLAQLRDAGVGDEQALSVMRVNEVFVQGLTALLLDITFARIGYEGGTLREQAPPAAKAPLPSEADSPFRAA